MCLVFVGLQYCAFSINSVFCVCVCLFVHFYMYVLCACMSWTLVTVLCMFSVSNVILCIPRSVLLFVGWEFYCLAGQLLQLMIIALLLYDKSSLSTFLCCLPSETYGRNELTPTFRSCRPFTSTTGCWNNLIDWCGIIITMSLLFLWVYFFYFRTDYMLDIAALLCSLLYCVMM